MRSGEGAEEIFLRLRERKEAAAWAETLCREVAEASGSALTAFYRIPGGKKAARWVYLEAGTGYVKVPERLARDREDLRIAMETGLTVVQNSPGGSFPGLLLSGQMRSGIAVRLGASSIVDGILIANHGSPFFYTGTTIRLLERLGKLLGKPES
jgi:hypothetical protein